jgi:hypothetical protein
MNINLQLDQQHSEQLNYIHQQENIKPEVLLNQAIEEQYYQLQSENGADNDRLFWSKAAQAYINHQSSLFNAALIQLSEQYPAMHVLFENGVVIDADVDEDVLLDRVWKTDFVRERIDKYQAIFCHFVPNHLNGNE